MAKFCGVCELHIHGETWDQHNGSQSHKHNNHKKECSIELEMEGGWHATTQSLLLLMFQKFGPVVKINTHVQQYPPAGLGMIEFSNPDSSKKVLQQTFYKVKTDKAKSGQLLKVTRWLPQKQRQANEELEERERSLAAEKERRFQEDINNTVKLAAITDEQITQLAWMQELTPSDQMLADDLKTDMEGIIQSYVPEVKVHLVGSSKDGLGTRGCDMNFEVAFDPRARRPSAQFLPEAPPLPENIIQQMGVTVKDGRIVYSSLREAHVYEILWFIYEILSKSNLSLKLSRLELHKQRKTDGAFLKYISFRYLKMQVDCQLHIKMSECMNCYNTQLTRLLVNLDDRVRPLYLALRYWAKRVQVFECLSSAGLFLLMYQYLQSLKPQILPSVVTLSLLDEKQQTVVRGYPVSFCSDVQLIKKSCLSTSNNQSLAELLQGFFKFYTKFDLSNRVFCPRTGKGYNMLKFRNMKKIMPTVARYPLFNKQLHIQDVFRLDTNVIEHCSVAGKHAVCAEIVRAEVITRGGTNTWNLLDLIPEDPINHRMNSQHSTTHIKIPFITASLPEGFLAYKSYAEAENQWYQWLVEITMRCLKILRVTYALEGDYGMEKNNGNKRQLLEDIGQRKKGNWSTFLDDERARDFRTTFVPTWEVVQESTLICTDKYNLWRGRSPRATNSKCRGVFSYEERVTEQQLQEMAKSPDKLQPIQELQFQLTISQVKSVNETQVDICGKNMSSSLIFAKFFDFFHEFLGRKISSEVGMGMTTLFDTF